VLRRWPHLGALSRAHLDSITRVVAAPCHDAEPGSGPSASATGLGDGWRSGAASDAASGLFVPGDVLRLRVLVGTWLLTLRDPTPVTHDGQPVGSEEAYEPEREDGVLQLLYGATPYFLRASAAYGIMASQPPDAELLAELRLPLPRRGGVLCGGIRRSRRAPRGRGDSAHPGAGRADPCRGSRWKDALGGPGAAAHPLPDAECREGP
jgi:hypothetical protein